MRTLFDAKAAGWPAKYAVDGRLAGRLAGLASMVGDLAVPGGQVLDLGCGSGELARYLAAAGYGVAGCDIAPAMLRQAAQAESTVRWIQLEPRWRMLPFETDSVDAVVSASVLEYVPDPLAVLAECARVLRPGGVLVCTVPRMSHPVRWLEWPLGLAARAFPGVAGAGGGCGSRRVAQYLVYLRTSCQRRQAAWWRATAARAGLELVPTERSERLPLRLLIFHVPGGAGGRHSVSLERP